MHRYGSLLIVLVVLSAPVLGDQLLECRLPSPPMIPDGAEAAEEEMLAAGEAVRSYADAVQQSLACLDRLDQSAGDARSRARTTLLYNNGVDQLHAVVNGYNTQVQRHHLASCSGVRASDHCEGVVPATTATLFRGVLQH